MPIHLFYDRVGCVFSMHIGQQFCKDTPRPNTKTNTNQQKNVITAHAPMHKKMRTRQTPPTCMINTRAPMHGKCGRHQTSRKCMRNHMRQHITHEHANAITSQTISTKPAQPYPPSTDRTMDAKPPRSGSRNRSWLNGVRPKVSHDGFPTRFWHNGSRTKLWDKRNRTKLSRNGSRTNSSPNVFPT